MIELEIKIGLTAWIILLIMQRIDKAYSKSDKELPFMVSLIGTVSFILVPVCAISWIWRVL